MLLDEPTQGMGLEDVDRVRRLIKKVAADRTVLMVEHNMSVVASIADTITVLQRGATLAEGPMKQVSKNPAVIEAYMGRRKSSSQGAHLVWRPASSKSATCTPGTANRMCCTA